MKAGFYIFRPEPRRSRLEKRQFWVAPPKQVNGPTHACAPHVPLTSLRGRGTLLHERVQQNGALLLFMRVPCFPQASTSNSTPTRGAQRPVKRPPLPEDTYSIVNCLMPGSATHTVIGSVRKQVELHNPNDVTAFRSVGNWNLSS